MIGQKIIDFDNLPLEKCTLKTFNTMFNMKVEGNDSSPVRIGKMQIGERRELFIGDKKELVSLGQVNHFTENGYVYKEVYEVKLDGKRVMLSVNFKNIATSLNCATSTISQHARQLRPYYGYVVGTTKVSEDEYNELLTKPISELKIDKSRRQLRRLGKPRLYNYTVELISGKKETFDSISLAAKFVNKGRKTIEHRVSKNNTEFMKGWRVERQLKGENHA